ncbi:MAG: hypothetical protein MJK04_17425 [Psychrosphaera sp.]|nr:hypothetical protein [Psychrosphaera sp.]
MKQSIENIWKEGFVDNDSLVAPKVIDLYNQKTKSIVDDMQRMFDVNLKAIVGGAAIFLAVSFFLGFPLFGLYASALLLMLVVVGKEEAKKLKQADKNVNSYEYLKTFDDWLKNVIARYTRLYTFFYPALFVGIILSMRASEAAQRLVDGAIIKFPDMTLIMGTPLAVWVATVVLTVLITLWAPALYRWDMNFIYGGVMKKLEELLADMEELRKS